MASPTHSRLDAATPSHLLDAAAQVAILAPLLGPRARLGEAA